MSQRSSRTTHHHRAEPDPRGLRRCQVAGTVVGAVLMLGSGFGVAAAETGGTGGPTVQCPVVSDRLPPVPASAEAEVTRNLALLNLQVAEANQRLETSRGQGGPNFVTNAILAPLADNRRATIERIAVAIGRDAERPTGLGSLAACRVTPGGAGGGPEATAGAPTASGQDASPTPRVRVS